MSDADEICVRAATVADLEVLVEFSAAMAHETEGRSLDLERLRAGTRAVFESPAYGFYLVAEACREQPPLIIGQLLITYEWSDWRNGVFWWVQSVYVRPNWRRRGVYRRMHAHLLAQAKARGDVCGVRLYVEDDNRTAQLVYARMGLQPTGYRICETDFVLDPHSHSSREDRG